MGGPATDEVLPSPRGRNVVRRLGSEPAALTAAGNGVAPMAVPCSGVGMSETERIEHLEARLAECERWVASHDGSSSTKWEAQERWIDRHERLDRESHQVVDHRLNEHSAKITDLRITVAKYVGIGSGIGAILGSGVGAALTQLFGGG